VRHAPNSPIDRPAAPHAASTWISRVCTAARESRRGLGAVALIALGLLAPLVRVWISGQTLVYRDSAMLFAPQRWLVGTALRELRLPLWNPYAGTGMPFLAETMHGALHPLSIAIAFLFPDDGLDPLLGAYVLSAGLGAAVLARCIGASRPAAVAAAFAYGLSGFTLSMTGALICLAGAASVPWMTAGLLVAGRDRTPAAFAVGAAGVATCALSGDLQMLLVGGVFGLCLAFEASRLRGLARAALSAAVGGLLAGVQLVPSWHFIQISNRAGAIGAGDQQEWALSGWRLLELALPGFFAPFPGSPVSPVHLALGGPTSFGAPFALSIFVGAPLLLLVATGARSSRSGRALGAAAIVFTWLALGHRLGAQQALSFVPIMRGFRYAEKYVCLLTLCVSMLAALGADRVAADVRLARRTTVIAIATSAVTLVAWLVIARDASASSLAALGLPQAQYVRMNLLSGFPFVTLGLASLAGSFLVARRHRVVLVPAIVGIVWLESALASSYALYPGHPEARLHASAPRLDAAPPGPRVLTPFEAGHSLARPDWNYGDQWASENAAMLSPSFNVRHRIDSFGIDSGIMPSRYVEALDAFGDQWRVAARRYGVTHVIIPAAKPSPSLGTLVGTDPVTGAQTWEVPHRPWASFAPAVEVVSDDAEASIRLRSLHERHSDAIVIEANVRVPVAPGVIHSVVRDRERLRISAETTGDSVLIINDAFSPGWRAWIDGVAVPIWPADVLVRAVPWPAGRHALSMEYRPREVNVGLCTSALGALLLVGTCVALRCRGRRRL